MICAKQKELNYSLLFKCLQTALKCNGIKLKNIRFSNKTDIDIVFELCLDNCEKTY